MVSLLMNVLFGLCLQKLYNEAKARKFQMEELNKFGGKYMKEVKVRIFSLTTS